MKIFASLYSRNYRLYFSGQSVSMIGTWIHNIALSWLVYRLSGSVFLLGFVSFTSQIPTFILGPFSGVLTDRHNKLRIMITAQLLFMLQALAMALLVLFNVIELWHIIALSIIFGIISALDTPARQSLVVDLIDNPANLGNAIALNSAAFNSARLIGPGIAGILIAAVGEGICFLINTFSFVAVIIALMLIRLPSRQRPLNKTRFRSSFNEGLTYTFSTLPIRSLIILLSVMSLVGFPFIVLLPAYAKEILGGSADTLGFLMSSLGAGALTGAIYMASRRSVLGLGKIIAIFSCIFGSAIITASFSTHLAFSMIILFAGGMSMILTLASLNTMLQTIVDEDKRGRVMSFYAMALTGITPIGNLLAGAVASMAGIPLTMLIGGSITVLSGILFAAMGKAFQQQIYPIYLKKGIVPEMHDI